MRNIKILSEQEYDRFWAEYVNIINAFGISIGDDAIADLLIEKPLNMFLTQNAVSIKTAFLEMMISTSVSQTIFSKYLKRTF